MVNAFTPYTLWLRERMLTPVWFGLGVFLYIMGHGPKALDWLLIVFVYSSLTFFRALDDWCCFEHDRARRSDAYQRYGSSPLGVLSLLTGVLYLSVVGLVLSVEGSALNLILIVSSLVFYRILHRSPLIHFVSLLKYPLILYLVGEATGHVAWIWLAVVSLFFLAREILEERLAIRSKRVEMGIAVLLVNLKLIMRYA
ncbi:MAG: hypothetical protein ACPGQS_09510 [Bradymonadia bacterium]